MHFAKCRACFDDTYQCVPCCTYDITPGGVSCWTQTYTKARCCQAQTASLNTPSPIFTSTPVLTSDSTIQLMMAGSVSEFDSSKIQQVKKGIADATGIGTDSITLTVKAGSVIVTATMPSTAALMLVNKIESKELTSLGGTPVVGAKLMVPISTKPPLDSNPATCARDPACFDIVYPCTECCSTGFSKGVVCWDSVHTPQRCCMTPGRAGVTANPSSPPTINPANILLYPPLPSLIPVYTPPTITLAPVPAPVTREPTNYPRLPTKAPGPTLCVDSLSACTAWAVIGMCTGAASEFIRAKCCLSCEVT